MACRPTGEFQPARHAPQALPRRGFGLAIHEFHRQSWRFVSYLKKRGRAACRAALKARQADTDITISVADAYNAGLERLARDFIVASP
jgi:hypothetical protein